MSSSRYRLAEGGGFSNHYSEGDLFWVINYEEGSLYSSDHFSKGSVIRLINDDGTDCPEFALVKGECKWATDTGFIHWNQLLPYTEGSELSEQYVPDEDRDVEALTLMERVSVLEAQQRDRVSVSSSCKVDGAIHDASGRSVIETINALGKELDRLKTLLGLRGE